MFGFLGSNQYQQVFEGNGHVVGASRFFGIGYIGLSSDYVKKERIMFDLDDVGSDPPQIYDTQLSPITNDGREAFSSAVITGGFFTGGVSGGFTVNSDVEYFYYNNNYIGYNYNSNAVLSPTTRKWRLLINRPDYIRGLAINVINGQGNSSSSNIVNHPLTFDLRQFPSVRHLTVGTGYFGNKLTITPNQKLENLYIAAASITGISGTLPSTMKTVQIGTTVTGVTTLLQNLNSTCELLTFGHPAGAYNGLIGTTTSLSGSLDISHLTGLKVFTLPQNNGLTSVNLPTGNTNWVWFHLTNVNSSVASSLSSVALNNMLASPKLKIFYFAGNGFTWARTIGDSEIASGLTAINIQQNSITGNINVHAAKPNLREFITGIAARTGAQQNSHPTVNISGVTGVRLIQMAGSNISNLELPTNTVCTTLFLGDNALSIATNPNLLAKVNAMTSLTSLQFSTGSNGAAVVGLGQSSAAGLGSNVSFTGLTSLTSLSVNACKISGTLTLPTGNALQVLQCAGNTGITSIVNLNKTSITQLQLTNMQSWTGALNVGNATNWSNIYLDNLGVSSVIFSGKTSNGGITGFNLSNSPNVTSIVFPANPHASENYRDISIANNAALASIPNFEKTVPIVNTGFGVFSAQNCALNITFPFGTGSSTQCIWRTIQIQNNGMSTTNVDATIDNIYQNRTKWNVWNGSHPKSLNISGTNATPTGTYQAPAGFVLGSNDGTPASAKEQAYVLVNNYGWTITMN